MSRDLALVRLKRGHGAAVVMVWLLSSSSSAQAPCVAGSTWSSTGYEPCTACNVYGDPESFCAMGSSGFGAGIQYCERGSFNLLPPGGWKGPYGLGVVCPINDVNCMYCTPPILAASCTTTSDIVCDCPAGAEKGVFRYREKYNMVQDVSYSCQQAPSGGYSAAIWAVGGILIVLVLLSLLRRLYRRWREKSLAAAAVTAATASTLAELSAKLALVNAELSSAREAQSPKALPAQATPAVAAAAAAGASLSSRLPDSSARRSQGQNEVDNGGSVDVDAVAVIQGAGAAAVSAVGGTAQAPSALHAAAAAAAAAAGSSAEVLLPGEIPSFLSDARAAVSGVLVSALNAVAPTLPLAGIAVSAVSAVLRQVEAMRTTSESSRLLAARLVRLRSLVQRAGDDDAFVEAHAALFEGLVATLQRAERALVRINERSRLSSFVMSSSDLERLVVVSGAVTLHLTELTAALQTETLSAVRSLHAAASAQYISAEGISAAVGAVVAGGSLRAVHAAAAARCAGWTLDVTACNWASRIGSALAPALGRSRASALDVGGDAGAHFTAGHGAATLGGLDAFARGCRMCRMLPGVMGRDCDLYADGPSAWIARLERHVHRAAQTVPFRSARSGVSAAAAAPHRVWRAHGHRVRAPASSLTRGALVPVRDRLASGAHPRGRLELRVNCTLYAEPRSGQLRERHRRIARWRRRR